MSNLETRPRESTCGAETPGEVVTELLEPRKVWLGKTTQVRRLLPNKDRRMVGAWCFVDHYGPDDVRDRKGMWVPPHPHTGLQTVSWLFEGEVLHRDSVGSQALVRPGELNIMTSGDGIAHSEESPGDHDPVLHGVQLWVALPDADRRTATPAFEQHRDLPVAALPAGAGSTVGTGSTIGTGSTADTGSIAGTGSTVGTGSTAGTGSIAGTGSTARVLVGELAGVRSPAHSFSPLVGAEVSLPPGATTRVPLAREFEYAVLVVDGPVTVQGEPLDRGQMLYVGRDRDGLEMSAAGAGRMMLFGGLPFEEHLVMWWNFIGRSHEDIVEAREQWMAGPVAGRDGRFGVVEGFDGDPLPAPPMPNTRLRPRGRSRDV